GKQIGMILSRKSLLAFMALLAIPVAAQEKDKESPQVWSVPEINDLSDDSHGRLVRRGRELILETYLYIGAHTVDPDKRFAGNDLACGNCHLEAGTKKLGLPIYGLFWDFPRYSARIGEDISIEDRINSCMSRSMNGRPLPLLSP